jgi:hypothetical protein
LKIIRYLKPDIRMNETFFLKIWMPWPDPGPRVARPYTSPPSMATPLTFQF